MKHEETIYETIGGAVVCFIPFWLCFTYSGRAVISNLLNLL